MVLLFVAAALLIQQSKAPGTFDDPNTTLRSAGVHGMIDASGYAASAAAKTQTQFYRQLTDLQTAALQSVWSSCSDPDRRRAIQLLAGGDFTGSAALLQTLLPSHNEPGMHQLLGLAYEGIGQLEAAAEQFRVAAAARPEEAAIFSQGVALLLAGEVTRAESVFRHAGAQSSKPGTLTNLGLGAALFERGQVREAFTVFLDAAAAKPDQAAPFGLLATAIRSADAAELTRCIEVLTLLTRKAPESGFAHYALACALASHDAPAHDVVAELEQAIALAPEIADAHFRLAEMYATNGSPAAAISEYRAALQHDPRLVEAHYRLGQIYAHSGRQSLAKEQFDLHRQMRAQQKTEIESGRVPIRLWNAANPSCQ